MSQPLRQAKRILEEIRNTGQVNEDVFVSLVVALRRLIEQKNDQKTVPTLWFYCNWCMHSEIDRGFAKDWLTRISKVMGESPPEVWYTDQVALTLSLDKLRSDLIKLFRDHSLNPFLLESLTNWQVIINTLCSHLLDTPLQRSDKIPPDSAHRFWIMKLQITLDDPGGQRSGGFAVVLDFHYDDIEGLHKNAQTSQNSQDGRMFMPMVIPEKPDAFKHP